MTRHVLTSPCRATLGLALLLVGAAHAQTPSTTAIEVEQFEPAPAQGVNLLNLNTSEVTPHLKPSVGLFFQYVAQPLVFVRQNAPDTPVDGKSPLESQIKGELWGSIGFFDRFDLGVVLPMVFHQTGSALTEFGDPGTVEGFAFADLRVIPKVQILNWADAAGFGVAIALPLWIPTGDDTSFNSFGAFRFQPQLVLEWRHRVGFALVGNVGYELRPVRRSQNIVADDALRWAVGLEIPTGAEGFRLLASVFGTTQFEDDVDPFTGAVTDSSSKDGRASPLEAVAALQFQLPAEMVINAGGGLGLNKAIGSPEFRVFLSIGRSPSARDIDRDGIYDNVDDCPQDPEDVDTFQDADGCPDPDNDDDGIRDADDACPLDAEDVDRFEDEDGCPEPDNDKDGILDGDDKCKNDPEDKDDFEDEDGCPDPDNDKDGIADVDDKCPLEPEDIDGWDDIDGCPDPDNDNDGFLDGDDKCPDEAETKNNYQDDDGCPDTKPRRNIRVTKTKIEILERVYFETGKAVIKKRSFKLLGDVAAVMNENPQITSIRVEGHTDSRGPAGYNMKLSQARAESVRTFLIEGGNVEPGRLVAKGFGETEPKFDNKSSAGRAKNRRVEFTIMEVNGKPVGPGPVILEKKEVIEK